MWRKLPATSNAHERATEAVGPDWRSKTKVPTFSATTIFAAMAFFGCTFMIGLDLHPSDSAPSTGSSSSSSGVTATSPRIAAMLERSQKIAASIKEQNEADAKASAAALHAHELHEQADQLSQESDPEKAAAARAEASEKDAEARRLRKLADTHSGIVERARADGNADGGPAWARPVPLETTRFVLPTPVALNDNPGGAAAYPPLTKMQDIVESWIPDQVQDLPNPFVETLAVLNFSDPKQRAMAETYRDAEMPFKVYDVPEIEETVRRWSDPDYLKKQMENVHYKVEKSTNNHFMYWTAKGRIKGWEAPTKIISSMSYKAYIGNAVKADLNGIDPEVPHHYLMLGTGSLPEYNNQRKRGKVGKGHFVQQDLAAFTPEKENFFVTNIAANKGIQCRFGMRGVIAEAHYDGGRNMVAMLTGAKRYILAPPEQCNKLEIIEDRNHPSFRHSTADWSTPETAAKAGFDTAFGIDTVVKTGEVLYIPSYWFHYIISLKNSVQCNTRSGSPPDRNGETHITKCMNKKSKNFSPPAASKNKKSSKKPIK